MAPKNQLVMIAAITLVEIVYTDAHKKKKYTSRCNGSLVSLRI